MYVKIIHMPKETRNLNCLVCTATNCGGCEEAKQELKRVPGVSIVKPTPRGTGAWGVTGEGRLRATVVKGKLTVFNNEEN